MFCIDFETPDLVSSGADHPWVRNKGVDIVNQTSNGPCIQGARCGYFNESHLEIPFFSNAYDGFTSLRITFSYMKTTSTSGLKGLVSNDCFDNQEGRIGNSLYAGCKDTEVKSGVKQPTVNLSTVSTSDLYLCCINYHSVFSLTAQTHARTHTHQQASTNSHVVKQNQRCFLYHQEHQIE